MFPGTIITMSFNQTNDSNIIPYSQPTRYTLSATVSLDSSNLWNRIILLKYFCEPTYLIVCEGEKTEPNYFKWYKKELDKLKSEFDRDSFLAQQFNDAIFLEKKGIKVAYSNEVFELWYLLHYHYYDSAISREEYQKMLTDLLKKPYKKNSETMYDDLQKSGGKQENAY